MKTVGLTGGIATGKSTAARVLRELGAVVIDADQVSRDVTAPGSPGLAAVVEAFGDAMLDDQGALNRKALGAVVMADPEARRHLEEITHPLIIAAMMERLRELAMAGEPAAVIEAALMVETGSWRNYSELWVVTCEPATQLERLMARNDHSREAAERWIGSQLPLAEKEAVATRVFRNDGGVEELRAAVTAAWAELVPPAE